MKLFLCLIVLSLQTVTSTIAQPVLSAKAKAITYIKKVINAYNSHASYAYDATLTNSYAKTIEKPAKDYYYYFSGKGSDSLAYISIDARKWITNREHFTMFIDFDSTYYSWDGKSYYSQILEEYAYLAWPISLRHDLSVMDIKKSILDHIEWEPAKATSIIYETEDSVLIHIDHQWADGRTGGKDSIYMEIVIDPRQHCIRRIVNWNYNGGESSWTTLTVNKFTFSDTPFDRGKHYKQFRGMKHIGVMQETVSE